MRRRAGPALAIALLLGLSACERPPPSATATAVGDGAITVASFNFPESLLLAEIYAQAMEVRGFRIERELTIGTRELVMPALVGGLVEFVPEYSGSALQFLAGPGSTTADDEADHRALVARLGTHGVDVLEASPAQDQNGFVVTAATAERLDLRTLSDLARVAGGLTFGGPPECATRPLCLPGLSSRYGIEFGSVVSNLDVGGPRTVAALGQGTIDVALLFTSDGAIELNDFVVLEDDRGLQPAEHVTPVIRADASERFGPGLVEIVNAVSDRLSTDELRSMNAEVARGASPSAVASAWLAANGLAGSLG